jgi:hypothetical protein
MIRDRLLTILNDTPSGCSATTLAEQSGVGTEPESVAAVEFLCLFSPELVSDGSRWKLATSSSSGKILAAIENYATSSGKKIFRLSAALQGLPAHEHPTEDELAQALSASHGRFQLLPNAMIKRNT